MADTATKLGDNVWIKGSVAVAAVLAAIAVYGKFNGIEQQVAAKWAGVEQNVAVMATKFDVLQKGQDEAVATLKEIRDNLREIDGERGKVETRLTVLEEWRALVDRKLDTLDRKTEGK